MNKQRLNMMKPDAVLVNAARGPVIDEKALVVRNLLHSAFQGDPAHCSSRRWSHPRRPSRPPSRRQAHLKANPDFRCGLDVFEDEPAMAPGLAECPNAVIVPHIASASLFTRGGMATLAAANVAARLQGLPVWKTPDDVAAFLDGPVTGIPKASPSIVNAKDLGVPAMH